jgi:exodeoxyribonuclease VII large subunit
MDLFSQPVAVPTVSALTQQIKQLLEGRFKDVMVQGEVSQPKLSSNGHLYFTLKDEGAQLPCVIWRGTLDRLGSAPLHGQMITAGGEIQLYAPSGRYQLIVNHIQQAGLGALQARFEALKAKLQAEGLFDQARKRAIPAFPKRIGVVTSESGAAFHDIRNTLERRWPLATLVLYHAAVQGASAVPEIVRAINYFSQTKSVDVIISGRGGGSLEDLWPFNEEAVARAIAASQVPVISAVGHETDFSISDFVADVRAATPTQAAVLATPDQNDIRMYLDELMAKSKRRMQQRLETWAMRVATLSGSHHLRRLPMQLQSGQLRMQQLETQLRNRMQQRLAMLERAASESMLRLQGKNPDEPLKRGFTRVMQDGVWIRNASQFVPEVPTELIWHDGKQRLKS